MKSLLRNSVVANIIPSQLPDNEGLISAGGQNHVRVLGVGGDLGHPPIVAPKGPSQLKGLGHGGALRHFLKNYRTLFMDQLGLQFYKHLFSKIHNYFPCFAQKYFFPPTFKALACLVNNAFTFNLLVVKLETKGEISSNVHLSLAANNTVNLSAMLRGREDSVNLLMTGGSLSSTKTRPASCPISVVIPSGTAYNIILEKY